MFEDHFIVKIDMYLNWFSLYPTKVWFRIRVEWLFIRKGLVFLVLSIVLRRPDGRRTN